MTGVKDRATASTLHIPFLLSLPPLSPYLRERLGRPVFNTVGFQLVDQTAQEHSVSQRAGEVYEVHVWFCHAVCRRYDLTVDQPLPSLTPLQRLRGHSHSPL